MRVSASHIIIFLAGLASASVGFLLKRNHLESGIVSAGKTEVTMRVTVRGTGGRPVKNARISAFDPSQVFLGQTNDDGYLDAKAQLNSGRSIILQAEGIAFKMRRDLLVPRASHYQASIFFDLAEVHEGNATLISSGNSETAKLVPKPMPRPRWLTLDFSGVQLDEGIKSNIINDILSSAEKMNVKEKVSLTCKSIQTVPVSYECQRIGQQANTFRFLTKHLPTKESDASHWLSTSLADENQLLKREISPNETIFVVRNGGQNFRAYLEGRELQFLRARPGTTHLRPQQNPLDSIKKILELVIVTETGLVLQKNVSWPPSRKFIVTRLPSSPKITDLSQLSQGN